MQNLLLLLARHKCAWSWLLWLTELEASLWKWNCSFPERKTHKAGPGRVESVGRPWLFQACSCAEIPPNSTRGGRESSVNLVKTETTGDSRLSFYSFWQWNFQEATYSLRLFDKMAWPRTMAPVSAPVTLMVTAHGKHFVTVPERVSSLRFQLLGAIFPSVNYPFHFYI